MGEVGSLWVTIGADTSKLQTGLAKVKTGLSEAAAQAKKTSEDYKRMADEATRNGLDFRNLNGALTDTIGRLRSLTPENARYAHEAGKVNLALEKGEISATQAAGALEKIKAQYAASRPAAERFGEALNSVTGYLKNVGIAAAVMGATFKTALDLGKQGAELEYAKTRFDRLTIAIGSTSDALMSKLRTATKGMMSDAEMIGSAGDIMSLGLAKTEDQVVRLVRVAAGLGMPMNQLVLALTNQTTMRFDQLNVRVDGFDERLKKLKDSGMDANSAFTEAFLQQAEAQLKTVGDKADSSVGSFQRLEVATKNLGDALKTALAPGLADAANAATNLITWNQKVADGYNQHEKAMRTTAKSYQEYIDEMVRAANVTGEFGEFTVALAKGLYGESQMADNARNQMRLLTEEQFNAFRVGNDLQKQIKDGTYAYEDWNDAEREAMRSGEGMTSVIIAQEEALAKTIPEIDEWGNTWKRNAETSKKYIEEAAGVLKAATGQGFGKEEADYAEKMAGIRGEIDETQAKIDELTAKPYLKDAQKKDLDENIAKLGELRDELEETARAHEEAMRRMAYNMLYERAASDGLTENEVKNLTEMAKSWGLYDDKTAAVIESVNSNIGMLDTDKPEALRRIIEGLMSLPDKKTFTVEMIQQGDIQGAYRSGAAGRAGIDQDIAESLTSTQDNVRVSTSAQSALWDQLVGNIGKVSNATGQIGPAAQKASGEVTTSLKTMDQGVKSSTDLMTILKGKYDSLQNKTIVFRVVVDDSAVHDYDNRHGGEADLNSATGADFVVPPGYPGDRYLIGVSSGERVKVETAAEQATKSTNNYNSGDTYVTVNVNGASDAQEVARQVVQIIGRKR